MTHNAMRAVRAILTAALCGWMPSPTAGAGPGAPPAPPERLSETGLYADIASGAVDAWNLPYDPQYPLWTDGAAKSRWIHVPDGATIDASDTDAWIFPVGTKFWKEFAFGDRKVETRLIWRAGADAWIFAAYVWNAEQTEALLVPDQGIRNAFPIAHGVAHSIPGRRDCASCHESGPTRVLGFSALQLSDDRDPMAPHGRPLPPGMVTLRMLDQFHLLSPRRRDLVDDPPRIRASSPVERAALGYLAGNCGHCHNTSGPLAPLGMALAHASSPWADAPEFGRLTTIGVASRYTIPGARDGSSRRVSRGSPELSAIVHRMASRRPSSQMPPLGTVLVDEDALALMRAWIAESRAARR